MSPRGIRGGGKGIHIPIGAHPQVGSTYIGVFVVSDEYKKICVKEKVETWVTGVKHLAGFARLSHQTAYVGLPMLLQQEFQFVQIINLSVGTLFVPL